MNNPFRNIFRRVADSKEAPSLEEFGTLEQELHSIRPVARSEFKEGLKAQLRAKHQELAEERLHKPSPFTWFQMHRWAMSVGVFALVVVFGISNFNANNGPITFSSRVDFSAQSSKNPEFSGPSSSLEAFIDNVEESIDTKPTIGSIGTGEESVDESGLASPGAEPVIASTVGFADLASSEQIEVAPIAMEFNYAMNRETVEDAFSISPELEGKFVWSNDQLLYYLPSDDLEAGDQYKVVIDMTAMTQQDAPLSYVYSRDFTVVEVELSEEVKDLLQLIEPLRKKDDLDKNETDRILNLMGKLEKALLQIIHPEIAPVGDVFGRDA